MTSSLALLLVVTGAAAAPAGAAQPRPAPEHAPVRIATPEDLARLCRALDPAERVRPAGDAVARGEAEALHASMRDAAILERYEVVVAATDVPFAPYDAPEQRLALQEPVQLPLGEAGRLWPTEERGLAVEADVSVARRVLDAQRRGALALALVFDLPDDATCGSSARGKRFTLPVEPVAWRWLDGETVLAAGGAAAERPLATAAQGARPKVNVGDPIVGPLEVKKAVAARSADLVACYAEALKRDPAIDGVLVADLAGAKPAIAADSVGDEGLAACVAKALGPLAPAAGGRSAVPIRFELAPPGTPDAPAR